MKLKKQAGQFNTYSAELTFGEILLIRDALANTPGMGPEADEMLEGFSWYLEKMPEPGEEAETKDGTSNTPNMAKDAADDALSPMLLEPAPGDEEAPGGKEPVKPQPLGGREEKGDDDETLGDHLGVSRPKRSANDNDEEELPEPPSRK